MKSLLVYLGFLAGIYLVYLAIAGTSTLLRLVCGVAGVALITHFVMRSAKE